MILPEITSAHLDEVLAVYHEVGAIKYYQEQRRRFTALLPGLSKDAVWLLTFSCWFCLFNFRFKGVDDSKYHAVPVAPTDASDFRQFIEVIRFFNRKKVTPSREGVLIKFLATCDQRSKDFYLSLLNKKFVKAFQLLDMQTQLDLDSISAIEIYGPLEMLTTSFADLTYPVAVTAISSPDLPLHVFSKEPHSRTSFELEGKEFVSTGNLLTADRVYANTPRYTIAGYVDHQGRCTSFYPVDFFASQPDFRAYCKEDIKQAYQQRLESLREFLTNNLLTQIVAGYVGYARNPEELLFEAVKVMAESECSYLCLSDQNTARTGHAYVVEARVATGIIHSIWEESDSARGFYIWFNGELFPCEFYFIGKNNALLNSSTLATGKLLEFIYIKVGEGRTGVGRNVLHQAKPWHSRRVKDTEIRVEKCIMCGGVDAPHESRGMCKVCERNLYRFYEQYGLETWIRPSNILAAKRRKAAWEPQLMNLVKYRFQDCYLEARDNGDWRFSPNVQALEQYISSKEKFKEK